MDKYLKMAMAFDLPVKTRHVHDENGYGFKLMLLHSVEAEYAAHAINSHDELVQMNQELLDIIKRVIDTSKELDGKVGTSIWTDGYKQCAIDTGSSLSDLLDKYKQKGGAA